MNKENKNKHKTDKSRGKLMEEGGSLFII